MAPDAGHLIPEYAQRKIARTNGQMWRSRAGRLTTMPIPRLPVPEGKGGLLLDIGCGWGRWCVAAARRGYVPVGVDIQFEAARATRDTMKAFDVPGHVVVADLNQLPFRAETFECAWSFSVLQHAHRDDVKSCLTDVAGVLRPGGHATFEFPTRWGVRNILTRLTRKNEEDLRGSWCVRYYTLRELGNLMSARFARTGYRAHAYFGTGILLDDLPHVPKYFAPLILASAGLAALAGFVAPLRWLADSVYVSGEKPGCRAADTPR